MKAISPELAAHFAGGTTTIARCWKCVRTDGVVFGFTNTDVDVVYEGVRYEASTGFTPSAVQNRSDLSVANLEVQGQLNSDSLTDEDINAGRWDFADIEIFLINYRDTSMGILREASGKIGEISSGLTGFTAEMRGLAQRMQRPLGELYSPSCRADFGDERCKFPLATVTVDGTLTSVATARVFSDADRDEPDDYFNNGKLTFLTGANAGLAMEIKDYESSSAGGQFFLYLEMPYRVAAGDTYEAHPGCGKRFNQDCRDRWANVVNFRGEPHVPGNDELLSVGGDV